jgi:hypothetical protein
VQIVATVGTFLARGNVFRTAFSMTSRLQGLVNSQLIQTVFTSFLAKGVCSDRNKVGHVRTCVHAKSSSASSLLDKSSYLCQGGFVANTYAR